MNSPKEYLVDGKYSFKELVAIDRLKDMFERFSQATGFTTGLISYPDQELLIGTGWRDICTKFHRAFPVSEVHCKQSNLELTSHLKERMELNIHHCESGLVDGATPIIIKGAHVANLATGQIFFEEPDIERFRKQGEAYGYDIDTYLEALGKVPVVTEEEFKDALVFLCEVAVMLAEQGLTNLQNRKTAQATQENEAKFRALVESSSDWIWESNKEGFYTYASPQVELMLGYKPEELVGKTPFDLMPPDEAARIAEIFEEVVRKGEPIVALENVNLHKNGRRIILETSGVPFFDEAGKVIGYRGMDRDITERKQTEEDLKTMQRLKSVGILAGGIAHDFNNILMGLYGNISLAKEKLSNDHPAFKSLEEAEKSMSRATLLSSQLLTFAKGGAPVRENVHVDELLKEITLFDLSGGNVKPVFYHADDLWIAEVDKGQIQQAFSNLIINAAQAMPDGGHLYITLENTNILKNFVPSLNQGKHIKVTVRDEGVGIDQDHLNRIFDPYFSTKQTGSGLGLATTYSIIRKHAGHIGVASELGKGTTFTLYLPASELQQLPETRIPEAAPSIGNQDARILVMDDEDAVRKVTANILEEIGCLVETASDGKQAIEMYRQSMDTGEPFDVVIMDLTVPGGMGGKEAVRGILETDPDAKVIVSSGYADNLVIANYAEYGFKGIAIKPYTMNKLREVVSKIMKK